MKIKVKREGENKHFTFERETWKWQLQVKSDKWKWKVNMFKRNVYLRELLFRRFYFFNTLILIINLLWTSNETYQIEVAILINTLNNSRPVDVIWYY